MHKVDTSITEPYRRLSPWRVMLAILLLAGMITGGIFWTREWKTNKALAASQPWFASYVDVTATPAFAFEQLGTTQQRNAVLSFIVSLPSEPCTPSWGAAYTMDQASAGLDLDRRIARLQQQGGDIAISFGGLKNDELAVKCAEASKLKDAYASVIERYNLDTIDLDLELQGLNDKVANTRRAIAIAELQKERRAKGKNLAVWVTLPVTPLGLSEDGTNAIALLLESGVDLAGVNIMTMDYGQSRKDNESMLEASESALNQTRRQMGVLYDQAGTHLNENSLWEKLGATPMIGQNDVVDEVFTLEDANAFNHFAQKRGIGRMSMWSANRDVPCGSNYVDLQVVSDSCSGIKQNKHAFAAALSVGFEGKLSTSAGAVTKGEAAKVKKDDPATSPYPIWTEGGAYLEGTKIVWRRNVYQAKWWTQGDVPDDPVLQAWQTPWELIGPVLPGEKPVPQATLPTGTYPDWSGTATYDAGQRVLFKGVPYQAKWWTQGNSPAAASTNANNSPWVPLTQSQVNEILAKNKAAAS